MELFKRPKKYHWYRMVFISGNTTFASNMGNVAKKITTSAMENSMAYSGAPKDALFISASYLGKMTTEDIKS